MTDSGSKTRHRPPRRGMSLGWRLAISCSIVVTAVMGVLTVLQHRREMSMGRQAREALLRESLAPLVHRLTTIGSEEVLRAEFTGFCHAFVEAGYPTHQMELRDSNGRVVMSTVSGTPYESGELFEVSVPVRSPLLMAQQGTLTLWEDASEYKEAVSRQWRSWSLHMVITLVPILLFLSLVTRHMVTRPLERLLDRIRKMEMGYWEQTLFDEGPWEIRWLGFRFRNLGLELKRTVQELMKAEKRASSCSRTLGSMPVGKTLAHEDVGNNRFPAYGRESALKQLLHRYHALASMPVGEPGRSQLAKEIWSNDAKRASQVGDMKLKAALEDLSLRILQPEAFLEIEKNLEDFEESLSGWVKNREDDLRRILAHEKVPYVSINYRVKHIAGIWKKMKQKGLLLDEVDDVYAFRIIVPSEPDCYWTLGVIHEAFAPVVGRFNDYIAAPKSNGYRSIHTCVRAATGPVFEVQIRSAAMHRHAEGGLAAHWLYKERQSVSLSDRPCCFSRLRRFLGV